MMLSRGSAGVGPRPWRSRSSAYVAGITCIRPMAPAGLVITLPLTMARPPLSRCITALIHCSGTSNRSAASAIRSRQGSLGSGGSGAGVTNATCTGAVSEVSEEPYCSLVEQPETKLPKGVPWTPSPQNPDRPVGVLGYALLSWGCASSLRFRLKLCPPGLLIQQQHCQATNTPKSPSLCRSSDEFTVPGRSSGGRGQSVA